MDKERQLYDSFVAHLTDRLKTEDITPKELDIIRQFLKDNDIQATQQHQGLTDLMEQSINLPFDEEDNVIPLREVK